MSRSAAVGISLVDSCVWPCLFFSLCFVLRNENVIAERGREKSGEKKKRKEEKRKKRDPGATGCDRAEKEGIQTEGE